MFKKKILIISDDLEFLDELKEILSMNENIVKTYDNNDYIINNIIKDKPELILLDLNLNNKNYFSILENINNNPDIMNIPIVLISNYFDENDHKKISEFDNIKLYVLKPINPIFFLSEIEKIKS